MKNLEQILEGLLFISGDGLDKGYIMEKLSVTSKEIDKAVEKLKEKYSGDSGIHLICYKDKIQLCSNPEYADDISVVLNPIRERNLSRSTLEVIAIICYKQPITRLEIEEIRRVNSDYAIQTLLNHKLIEVVGRKDAVGKPLLFGTTDEFLKRFQIKDLNELPDYDDIMKQVEVIESQKTLYNEFEVEDDGDDQIIINGQVVSKKSMTLEELNGERKEQMRKDDMLLEDLANSQKALEAMNKRVLETVTKPKEEPKPDLTQSQIDMLKNEADDIPDFLKNDKNLHKVE